VSNYQLMMDLIAYCADHTITQILALPDVKERVDLYFDTKPERWSRFAAARGSMAI
jgi:hypothetical protein